MKTPDEYLLDELIRYAEENGLTLDQAALHVAGCARQRAPEYRVEKEASVVRARVREEIQNSPREELVARVLVRSRVHYISWTYYPEYHVVGGASEVFWHTIRFPEPDPQSFSGRGVHYYIDDLFYDEFRERFWMPEPYLRGLPSSQALYRQLVAKKAEGLAGTRFRKVSPKVMADFIRDRKDTPVFLIREGNSEKMRRRPPYGSKGWKERLSMVRPFGLKWRAAK